MGQLGCTKKDKQRSISTFCLVLMGRQEQENKQSIQPDFKQVTSTTQRQLPHAVLNHLNCSIFIHKLFDQIQMTNDNDVLDQAPKSERPVKPKELPPGMELASGWVRALAQVLDYLVCLPIFALSFYNSVVLKSFLIGFVSAFGFILYKLFTEGQSGKTLGKRMLKIKVIRTDMQDISLADSASRNSIFFLIAFLEFFNTFQVMDAPGWKEANDLATWAVHQDKNSDLLLSLIPFVILLVLIISIFVDKYRQGLHDKIGKTIVVQD